MPDGRVAPVVVTPDGDPSDQDKRDPGQRFGEPLPFRAHGVTSPSVTVGKSGARGGEITDQARESKPEFVRTPRSHAPRGTSLPRRSASRLAVVFRGGSSN